MKLSVLITSLLITTAFSVKAQTKSKVAVQKSSIDSVLNQVLKDQHIAGFAVAIVKGDQVIYSKGFGYRDLENKNQ